MKKVITIVLALVMLLSIVGCKKSETQVDLSEQNISDVNSVEVDMLSFEDDISFKTIVGSGGVCTLTLSSNGSYYGEYEEHFGVHSDEEVVFQNEYWGTFINFVKLNETSYSIELDYFATAKDNGVITVEDGITYQAIRDIPGIFEGTEYILYMPDTPISEVSGEVVNMLDTAGKSVEDTDTIGAYFLQSLATRVVFCSDESIVDTAYKERGISPDEFE